MNIKTLITALGASAFALALDGDHNDAMIHPQMRRALLEPRQTIGDLPDLSPSCTSALLGLYKSLPTPAAKLAAATEVGTGEDACSESVPDSLTSDLSSYESAVSSWFSKSSKDISSALEECTELSSLVSQLPGCARSVLDGGAGGSGGGASATSTSTHSGKHSSATMSSGTGKHSSDGGGGAGGHGDSSSTDSSHESKSTKTDTATGAEASSTSTDAGAARETGMAVAALAAGIAAAIL